MYNSSIHFKHQKAPLTHATVAVQSHQFLLINTAYASVF